MESWQPQTDPSHPQVSQPTCKGVVPSKELPEDSFRVVVEHVSNTPRVVARKLQGDPTFEPLFPKFVIDAFLHSLGNKGVLGIEGEPQPEIQVLFGWRLEKRVPRNWGD